MKVGGSGASNASVLGAIGGARLCGVLQDSTSYAEGNIIEHKRMVEVETMFEAFLGMPEGAKPLLRGTDM